MKITFEIPDSTCGAFLNFVYVEGRKLCAMGVVQADTKDLIDGGVVKFEPPNKEDK